MPAWAEDVVQLSPVAEAGRSFFLESCAACHGGDGRGGGPAAAAFLTSPADLTLISARRAGAFPVRELAEIIDGRTMVTAHGDREMPVWGERFSDEESGDSMKERLVQGRIRMLLVYIQAIQR
jgi:mono/diheme cytochrome c family protein